MKLPEDFDKLKDSLVSNLSASFDELRDQIRAIDGSLSKQLQHLNPRS